KRWPTIPKPMFGLLPSQGGSAAPAPPEVATLVPDGASSPNRSGAPRFPSRPTPDRISETMKPRTTTRLAWATGLATIALMAGALVLMFVDRHAALPPGATRWRFSDVLFEVAVVGVP